MRHLDVDTVSVEEDLDASFREDKLDIGSDLLYAGNDVSMVHDRLEFFRGEFFSIELDYHRVVALTFGKQDEFVEGSQDLNLLHFRFHGEFLHVDSEVGVLTTAAVLDQHCPAGGEGDGVFDLVEGLDVPVAHVTDWTRAEGGHRSNVVQEAEHRSGVPHVDWSNSEGKSDWDVFEGRVLVGSLDSEVEVLFGHGVDCHEASDLLVRVPDLDLGNFRLPEEFVLEESVEEVGVVLDEDRNTVEVQIEFVFEEMREFVEVLVLEDRAVESHVVL
jgi:hypothetical protein